MILFYINYSARARDKLFLLERSFSGPYTNHVTICLLQLVVLGALQGQAGSNFRYFSYKKLPDRQGTNLLTAILTRIFSRKMHPSPHYVVQHLYIQKQNKVDILIDCSMSSHIYSKIKTILFIRP